MDIIIFFLLSACLSTDRFGSGNCVATSRILIYEILKTVTKRYATSKDLLGYFRSETPDYLKHIITELFESVEEVVKN